MFLKLCFIAFKIALVILTSLPITRSWKKVETRSGVEWALYECDGQRCRHVGSFRERDNQWLPFDGRRFGAPDCLPFDIDLPDEVKSKLKPAPQSPEPPLSGGRKPTEPKPTESEPASVGDLDPQFNQGINLAELHQFTRTGPPNSINGNAASYESVAKRIASLADDSAKPHLTLVADTKAQNDKVLADIAASPLLQPLREHWRIQAFSRDQPTWPMAQVAGFKVGSPAIYFQALDGKVVHRQDAYDGAEKLADVERLADPNYDPAKDPNVLQPKPAPGPLLKNVNLADVPGWLWGVAAGVAILLLFPARRQPPAVA